MQKLTIQIPLYRLNCVVIIDKDIRRKINSYNKSKKWQLDPLTDEEDVCGMAINPHTTDMYYIFFAEESLTCNVIAHEISHLVDYILEDKGVNDGEARAFLSGFINEKVFDYLIKNKLLINKWLYKTEKIQTDKDLLGQ